MGRGWRGWLWPRLMTDGEAEPCFHNISYKEARLGDCSRLGDLKWKTHNSNADVKEYLTGTVARHGVGVIAVHKQMTDMYL